MVPILTTKTSPFLFIFSHSLPVPVYMTINSSALQTHHITTRAATTMAYPTKPNLLFLFFCLVWATFVFQGAAGSRTATLLPYQISASERELRLEDRSNYGWKKRELWRRSMIGSVKPTCTYNECRGCRYRCRAEQVPVEGNDPINSAYHYRCVCHR